ncbi:MAG: hypothetical protein QW134_09360, partial [Nitrososphaeria archaeon]
NPFCEVWFDNIVVKSLDEEDVTPTPTFSPTITPIPTQTPIPLYPIVFLPGLGASINYEEMFLGIPNPNGWKMTPGANLYKNILNIFSNDSNFYLFNFDWRKSVSENANNLYKFIENKINSSPKKVNLLGHSLGGLVARTCVQTKPNNCFVNKLITVGSPQLGAVDAYPALEGGEIWRSGPVKMLYELLVHYYQRPGETRRETIQRIAPVLFDLLPTFNYLIKNDKEILPNELTIKNNLLPNISEVVSIQPFTKAIIGRNCSTVEKIILEEPNFIDNLLGDWLDGKPKDKIYTLEGDTSVLVKSASFGTSNIESYIYDLDH